jgi:hypothetical protein
LPTPDQLRSDRAISWIDEEGQLTGPAVNEMAALAERVHHGLAESAISDENGTEHGASGAAAPTLECAANPPHGRRIGHAG